MAKIDLKFIDSYCDTDFIQVKASSDYSGNDVIEISGKENGNTFKILLDKSTSIKFAKTLRTEINKIKESEVNNG